MVSFFGRFTFIIYNLLLNMIPSFLTGHLLSQGRTDVVAQRCIQWHTMPMCLEPQEQPFKWVSPLILHYN